MSRESKFGRMHSEELLAELLHVSVSETEPSKETLSRDQILNPCSWRIPFSQSKETKQKKWHEEACG